MHNWTRVRSQVQIEPEKDVLLAAGTLITRYLCKHSVKTYPSCSFSLKIITFESHTHVLKPTVLSFSDLYIQYDLLNRFMCSSVVRNVFGSMLSSCTKKRRAFL